MKALSILTFFLACHVLQAQSVTGRWKSIDDNSGKARSIVEIYEEKGKIYGKIVKLFREPNEDQDPVCDKCTGAKAGKKIIGLVIIEALTKSGNYYSGGTITDPENGRSYACKIWLENGKLMVRGYWGIFYRTQTWVRAD